MFCCHTLFSTIYLFNCILQVTFYRNFYINYYSDVPHIRNRTFLPSQETLRLVAYKIRRLLLLLHSSLQIQRLLRKDGDFDKGAGCSDLSSEFSVFPGNEDCLVPSCHSEQYHLFIELLRGSVMLLQVLKRVKYSRTFL